MYGQMPHFLKTYNKKIYIHNDIEKKQGFGTWWVTYKKREFHINPSYCNYYAKYYSACALIMVHELAHVIQQLTGVISPSKWLTARRLDNKKYVQNIVKKIQRKILLSQWYVGLSQDINRIEFIKVMLKKLINTFQTVLNFLMK